MALKAIYESKDDIPEQYQDLYTERDGKWELTGVEGVKTQADIDRVQSALTKERNDHKETKDELKKFADIDLEQIEQDKSELTELRAKVEAGAGGEFDEDKFNEAVNKVVEAKVATMKAPLEKQIRTLTDENETLKGENEEFRTKETTRSITDAVRKAAGDSKVIEPAMDDVLMLAERVFEVQEDGTVTTRDGVGVTPGIAPDIWLTEMQQKRPHWWPTSQGGGAGGSGHGNGFADNPWSPENWNLTQQGKIYRENPQRATQMAQAAGSQVGAVSPPQRKQGQQSQHNQ